jgi:uncharacterized protein
MVTDSEFKVESYGFFWSFVICSILPYTYFMCFLKRKSHVFGETALFTKSKQIVVSVWLHDNKIKSMNNADYFPVEPEKNHHLCKDINYINMTSKASVDSFLGQKHIALAGYSRDTKKFGHEVYKTLKEKGYTIYPVNPAGGKAPGGETIYSGIDCLPAEVKALLVLTKPEVTAGLVEKAIASDFEHIWIQQMSGDKQLYESLAKKEVNAVSGSCILLHAQPTGIHKFHRWLLGLFGKLPK